MAINCDPQALNAAALCFTCIPQRLKPQVDIFLLNSISGVKAANAQALIGPSVGLDLFNNWTLALAGEVYLLAKIAGGSTDPSTLANAATCFWCKNDGFLEEVTTYLLAQQNAGITDPRALQTAASSYMTLLGIEWRVELYLFCQWALSLGVVPNCDGQTLVKNARCFENCLNDFILRSVRAYLLCQIVSLGLAGGGANLIPPGSLYTCNPTSEFDIAVNANTNYQICWGANDVSMTFGTTGDTYASTGVGSCIVVYTSSNTLMKFAGNACNVAVTATLGISIGSVPIATGLDWFADGTGANLTANWDAPPNPVSQTEVWTSPDNVTYALAATVNVPTTTATIAGPAIGSFLWAKIRWKSGTQTGIFGPAQMMSGRVTDRIKRVVTNNGGALPLHLNQRRESTFDNTLFNNGLDTMMIELSTFEPSNLISAITPLYVLQTHPPFGQTIWANTAFVAGDLTINGLKGDGATKFLATNLWMTDTPSNNSGGITVYNVTAVNEGTVDAGYLDGGGSAWNVQCSNGGNSNGECWTFNADGLCQAANLNWTGYISVNRIANNSEDLYIANSTTPHASLVHNANAVVTTRTTNHHMNVFAAQNSADLATNLCTRRLSFAAFHAGLTTAQSLTFFNAVQALRKAYGGGFV